MLTPGQKKFLETLNYKAVNRKVEVYPWDPVSLDVADDVIGEIKQIEPNLEILLMGSVPLKIAGERDLDITVYCPKTEQAHHGQNLVKILGEHSSSGEHHIGWEFNRDGFHVTVYLADPTSSNAQAQKQIFEKLRDNPELAKEYEQIKLTMNGKTYKEYQLAKYEFYNKVLGINEQFENI